MLQKPFQAKDLETALVEALAGSNVVAGVERDQLGACARRLARRFLRASFYRHVWIYAQIIFVLHTAKRTRYLFPNFLQCSHALNDRSVTLRQSTKLWVFNIPEPLAFFLFTWRYCAARRLRAGLKKKLSDFSQL